MQTKELLNVSVDVAGEEVSAVASERNPVRPHQELLEVPGDVVPADRAPDDAFGVGHEGVGVIGRERKLLFQEDEQRMGVFPVHISLLEELELGFEAVPRADVLQGGQDLLVLQVLLQMNKLKLKFGVSQVSSLRASVAPEPRIINCNHV